MKDRIFALENSSREKSRENDIPWTATLRTIRTLADHIMSRRSNPFEPIGIRHMVYLGKEIE
jgi:hypothetical protein